MSRLPPGVYPRDGWIAEYLNYAQPGLRAPRIYHLTCGLLCVSAAAGPHTRVLGAGDPVPLNLNVCLVGPSGFAQKSRTIERARQILLAVREGILLPDEFSREQLFRELDKDAHRVLLYREFGKLLQISRRDYMAGTLEFLTELYDCPPHLKRSLSDETFDIKQPYVSTLAASTAEWLFPHMARLDILAGYFPRFLFAPFDGRLPRAAALDPPDQATVSKLVKRLHDLTQRPRELRARGVLSLFHAYEDEVDQRAAVPGSNPLLAAFLARLPLLALKVAGCLELAQGPGEELSQPHLTHAITLVEHQFEALAQGAARRWESNRDAIELDRVRDLVQAEPDILHSRLLRNSHLTARRLGELLYTLQQTGELLQQGAGRREDPWHYRLAALPEEKGGGANAANSRTQQEAP